MYKKAIIASVSLLLLDFMWLGLFMGSRYKTMIQNIQKEKMAINFYGAIIAYTLMVYLLIDVVIKYDFSVLKSFLFGFSVYGIYDMTCLAVLKNWDIKLAFLDMLWGGFLYALVKYISDFIR